MTASRNAFLSTACRWVTVATASGWTLDGIHEDGQADDSLQLTRSRGNGPAVSGALQPGEGRVVHEQIGETTADTAAAQRFVDDDAAQDACVFIGLETAAADDYASLLRDGKALDERLDEHRR